MNKNLDIGIIANTANQFLLGCKILNEYIINRPEKQSIIFHTNDVDYFNTNLIPILPICECKFFYGNLLVFDIQGLTIALDCPNISQIILYLQDHIWQSHSNRSYFSLYQLFNHPKIVVVATDEQKAHDYYHCWSRKPDLVCGDISYDKLSQVL